jgi:hypothetical protein
VARLDPSRQSSPKPEECSVCSIKCELKKKSSSCLECFVGVMMRVDPVVVLKVLECWVLSPRWIPYQLDD